MITKILVPTDGSDHAKKAVEFACDLASKYKATIYLVHVIPPLVPIPEVGAEILGEWELTHQRYAKEIIVQAENDVKKKNIESYQSTILKGSPAQEIVEFAKKNKVDMIIMGSHGHGKAGILLLGSVSNKVCNLAESTCITVK
jgi:nucleotide-binding universal stress UspA family protein